MQAAQHEATAAALEDFASLRSLHWDGARGQFLDYGSHTDAVELRWVLYRDADGRPVAQHLERAVLAQPRPQHVPHFGCEAVWRLNTSIVDRKHTGQCCSCSRRRLPARLSLPCSLGPKTC